MKPFDAPAIAYGALLPILVMLAAALLGVLVEAFAPRESRYSAQVGLSVLATIVAFVCLVLKRDDQTVTVGGALAIDGFGQFMMGLILLLALLAVMLMAERSVEGSSGIVAQASLVAGSAADRRLAESTRVQTEIFPLTSFAVSGMLIFSVANNLLLMFVALEVLSLPLYLMAGLSRRRRLLSQEAAVKYFLLGAFASAFFLYGLALLYGYADTVDLAGIFRATSAGSRSDVLLFLGLALLLVGLLFKAGIAPFHSWTPDVYQGAPTSVTAFFAACTKVAAFAAILRVLYVGFGSTSWDWKPVLWAVAIVSMVVGAVFGLTQTDVKRVLAYSSIAHAGFILVGLISLSKDGIASVLFYLSGYGFSTIAAFGLVTLVRDPNGEATRISQWSGMAKRSPFVATIMTVLLLSMAGIPLTAGFTGKFYVFRAAYDSAPQLVVIALVTSAVAAFFYLRIIVLMFFAPLPDEPPDIAVPSPLTTIALTAGVVVTVLLGVVPQPLIDIATGAATLRG
ncbi:NADH-quinone oxidoreductase subunit NuoN [Jatrophihabitans sp. YIM 134969]